MVCQNCAGPESEIGLACVNVVCVYGRERGVVGGGGGLEVLKCFVRGGQNFFLLALCVCVCEGGGCQVQYLSFREKITDPSY